MYKHAGKEKYKRSISGNTRRMKSLVYKKEKNRKNIQQPSLFGNIIINILWMLLVDVALHHFACIITK